MYFIALAIDYDGTLASDSYVQESTIEALVNCKASGRKLIMVTGRQLDDLQAIFSRLDLFDRIVAENGALLYTPESGERRLLADPPPAQFLEEIKNRGLTPLMNGYVIVATEQPQENVVLEVIRDMGLALEIIFNKGSVMVLPSGINKATGLASALKELGLSMHNVLGIGDAENDLPFLHTVGLAVAVANCNESVKQSAAFVTKGARGAAVEECIDQILKDEQALIAYVQHKLFVGIDHEDLPFEMNPIDRLLIAGSSGIGKSTLATALTEKMVEKGFQFCLFDPEGDYEQLENAIGVGEIKTPPSLEQTLELLQEATQNVVVNTLGIDIKDRPSFFVDLASKLVSLKAHTGRPHWLIMDEAHHLIPAEQENASLLHPQEGTILITVHPETIAVETLKTMNLFLILGPEAPTIMQKISQVIDEPLPNTSLASPSDDRVLLWQRFPISRIAWIKADKPKQQHKRHTRKYAEGDLSEEYCFYFTGPKNALHLKAQNLMIFLQIAEGVDDETWLYHLHRKDYSDWFRKHIKDDHLAEAAAQIESDDSLSAEESRAAIATLVKELYTAPASVKN